MPHSETFIERLSAELFQCEVPVPVKGNPNTLRSATVVRQVFDLWTSSGSHPAALAERFIDGSITALEGYLLQDSLPSTDGWLHQPDDPGIPRRHAEQLSYEEFVADFMLPNRPVMIQGTNRGWRASKDWVTGEGAINIDFLRDNFGGARVSAMESSREIKAYGGGKCHEMTLREYLETCWDATPSNEPAMLFDAQYAAEPIPLYLKDWHFVNEFPDYKAYECPTFFRDDWLNDYHDQLCSESGAEKSQATIATSDYRFVYLGRKGTWTPIHADVLRSYSWSTNVAGKKRWLLLAPEHTPLLLDRFGRDVAPSFHLAAQDPDAASRFPNLARAAQLALEVYQGADESLFVPSGWHHSVENVEDTLSINHNWLNAYNIHWGWDLMKQEHSDAAAAIEDCRGLNTLAEFEDLVQRNMAANCGMNYFSLARFVGAIALRQVARLSSPRTSYPPESRSPECQTKQLLEAFSLHRAVLVLKDLLRELQASYDVSHRPAGGAAVDGQFSARCGVLSPGGVPPLTSTQTDAADGVQSDHSALMKMGGEEAGLMEWPRTERGTALPDRNDGSERATSAASPPPPDPELASKLVVAQNACEMVEVLHALVQLAEGVLEPIRKQVVAGE